MVGIAKLKRAQRHAVEAEQQHLGLEGQRGQLPGDVGLEGSDMAGVVVIGRQGADRGLPAHGRQRLASSIDRGGGGGARILRIERGDENAGATGLFHPGQLRAQRRIAIAHGMGDLNCPKAIGAQPGLERAGLGGGDRGERRALVGPDLGIGMGRFLRPGVENDAAQDRLP